MSKILPSRGENTTSPSLLSLINGRILISFCIMAISAYAGIFSKGVDTKSIIFQVIIIAWLLSGPLSRWVLGQVDVLDPVALLSLFGIHYFIFGPIYQLSLDYWPFLPWTSSVEAYVAVWYWWQVAIISISFISLTLLSQLGRNEISDTKKTIFFLKEIPIILVVVTFVVKLATIVMLGGFSGIIDTYQARLDGGGVSENNTFAGLGVVIAVGNAFPIAFGYWVIFLLKDKYWAKSRLFLVAFAVTMFAVTFASNGLMGSRANVIYAVVIVLALYHFVIRPFRVLQIILAIVVLFSFSQLYYSFKFGGIEGLLSGQTSSSILKGRQIDDLSNFGIIRDYTRMDVQTLAIYSVDTGATKNSWGRSYLGGVAAIIPSAIWPSRMDSFTLEKSRIMFGRNDPGKITNLVFGGFGEAYVNFGILSALLSPVLGLLLYKMRKSVALAGSSYNLHVAYKASIMVIFPIMLLIYDSNSLLYVIISAGMIPFIYSFLSKNVMVANDL